MNVLLYDDRKKYRGRKRIIPPKPTRIPFNTKRKLLVHPTVIVSPSCTSSSSLMTQETNDTECNNADLVKFLDTLSTPFSTPLPVSSTPLPPTHTMVQKETPKIQLHASSDWQDLLTKSQAIDPKLNELCVPESGALIRYFTMTKPSQPVLLCGGCGSGKTQILHMLAQNKQLVVKNIGATIHETYDNQIANVLFRDNSNRRDHLQHMYQGILQLILETESDGKQRVLVLDDADWLPAELIAMIFSAKGKLIKCMTQQHARGHLLLTTSTLYDEPMRRVHQLCKVIKLPDITPKRLSNIMYRINAMCHPNLSRPDLMDHMSNFGHDLRYCLINYTMAARTNANHVDCSDTKAEAVLESIKSTEKTQEWQVLAAKYGTEVDTDNTNLSHIRESETSVMHVFRTTFRHSLTETFIALQHYPLLPDLLHRNWSAIFRYDTLLRCETMDDLRKGTWILVDRDVPMSYFCAIDILSNYSFVSGVNAAITVGAALSQWMLAALFKLPGRLVSNVNIPIVPSKLDFPNNVMLRQNHTSVRQQQRSVKLNTVLNFGDRDCLIHMCKAEQTQFQIDTKGRQSVPDISLITKALLFHQIHEPHTPLPDNLFVSKPGVEKLCGLSQMPIDVPTKKGKGRKRKK